MPTSPPKPAASRPVWISHRGFKLFAVENTRAAFDAAVAQGFNVLETDLRLTADGHVVLHHDPTLVRLAKVPTEIAASSRAELERVRLPYGARLLFLDEFMDAYREQQWVFDVKPETGRATLDFLAQRVAKRGDASLLAKTTFTVWSLADQRHLERVLPGAKAYAREAECWRAGLSVLAGTPALGGMRAGTVYAVPPRLWGVELYTDAKVGAYHRHGARVLAFLPETEQDTRRAIQVGVDEILTNGPILAEHA